MKLRFAWICSAERIFWTHKYSPPSVLKGFLYKRSKFSFIKHDIYIMTFNVSEYENVKFEAKTTIAVVLILPKVYPTHVFILSTLSCKRFLVQSTSPWGNDNWYSLLLVSSCFFHKLYPQKVGNAAPEAGNLFSVSFCCCTSLDRYHITPIVILKNTGCVC